jgi:hypothetical protein
MRRAYIIGTMALGLTFAAVRGPTAYGRVANSARSFRQYFHDLQGADSTLNPVERFVFSLMLANTKQPPPQR